MQVLFVALPAHLMLLHWRRNLFGRHGNSRTTFEGGTARIVKCRTTFQQSAGQSAVYPEE